MVIKRSIMTLYSGSLDIPSHRVRIVLAEKGIAVDVKYVDPTNPPEDLLTLNPYNILPTLVDRELVLYDTDVISEYLDERFPHPPLLPVYPIARAKCRLMIYRMKKNWLALLPKIQQGKKREAEEARKQIRNDLTSLTPLFTEMPYFLSEDFSLVDCCLAPMLWRLPSLGVAIPTQAKAIHEYKKRIFSRDSFKSSLSELEQELHDTL